MKKVLILAAALALSAVACKKSGMSPGIYGKWELRHQSGGWGVDSTYKAGNGNVYLFARNNTYKKYENSILIAEGNFSVRQDNGAHPEASYVICFDNSAYGDPIGINGTTITIGTSVADGIESEYQKVSN